MCINSCVDRFDPRLTNPDRRLVVEGRITTEPIYHWVFLTYDAGYNSRENNFDFLVKNATVWVEDLTDAKRYDFIDSQNDQSNLKTDVGFDYRSKDKFAAIIGHTYQLNIVTEDKSRYRSKPETVVATPKLEKVYWEYRPVAPGSNRPRGEFMVYADVLDSPKPNEFYKWESVHWFQQSYCRYWDTRPPGFFKDPCCGDCFDAVICNECSQIADDRLVNGKEIRKQFIAKVPYDNVQPYYLEVKQYSISEEVHRFWATVQLQAKNTGGLFDVTPKAIRGNLESITNPNEEVLGIFAASDVSEKILYVFRNQEALPPYEPIPETAQDTFRCFPCEESYNRSSTRPRGWISAR
jgi:hypothetical protein